MLINMNIILVNNFNLTYMYTHKIFIITIHRFVILKYISFNEYDYIINRYDNYDRQ